MWRSGSGKGAPHEAGKLETPPWGRVAAEASCRRSRVVAAAGGAAKSRIPAVGDGGPELALPFRERCRAYGRHFRVLYHAGDYLAAARPGDQAGSHRRRYALQAGRLPSVLDAWRERREPPEAPKPKASARANLCYLENPLAQPEQPPR